MSKKPPVQQIIVNDNVASVDRWSLSCSATLRSFSKGIRGLGNGDNSPWVHMMSSVCVEGGSGVATIFSGCQEPPSPGHLEPT